MVTGERKTIKRRIKNVSLQKAEVSRSSVGVAVLNLRDFLI